MVSRARPAPFRGRHFADVIIILCVRWYLRYSLSYRDLEEIMAERGLPVDHVTISFGPKTEYCSAAQIDCQTAIAKTRVLSSG